MSDRIVKVIIVEKGQYIPMDMVLVERDEWERLKGIEEGLKAMIQRMGAEATSAAINSVAKYGKLYKELAKK